MGFNLKNTVQPQNQPVQPPKNPLQVKYDTARSNLLAMLAFTLINFVLTIAQADMYFLFSATFPQASLIYGYVLEAEGLPGMYAAGIVLGVVCIGLYFLCWLLSKKNPGWLIAAAVLFAVDTVLLFVVYELDASIILDVVFHAWVLYYLIAGVVASNKLKNQPEEPVVDPMAPVDGGYPMAPQQPQTVMLNGEPVEMDSEEL